MKDSTPTKTELYDRIAQLERELAAARAALALPIHVLAHTLTQDELKLLGEQVALARAAAKTP